MYLHSNKVGESIGSGIIDSVGPRIDPRIFIDFVTDLFLLSSRSLIQCYLLSHISFLIDGSVIIQIKYIRAYRVATA